MARPNRDGISKETGLLKSWQAGGPKVLWRVPSGEGYAGIVIAKGRGYTMYGQAASDSSFASIRQRQRAVALQS
jgi:hypothetical protein